MRIAAGIVVGLVVAFACVLGVEMIGHALFPPPDGIDLSDPAEMERMVSLMPAGALAFVVAAWFIGALVGAWLANLIAKRALAGWVVVLLVICGGIYTMVVIPHPAWMWAAGIGLPLLAAWLAQRFARVPA
jgi:hypothetical protein